MGAASGLYTLFLASNENIRRVWALEPYEANRRMLEGNLAINVPALRAKVEIVQKFVCDEDDNVRYCRLDREVAEATRPIFMKVDVDGPEAKVLRGAETILSRGGVYLVVETHSLAAEQECMRILEGAGYRTKIVQQGWYRRLLRTGRPLPHNRWVVAE